MSAPAAPPFVPPKTIVLVGLMGAGQTSIGRRLATRLQLPFVDADQEIEAAAGETIEEIFARHGEAAFRDGERRVIARLLDGPPRVLATGGGAYMDPQTRAAIRARGISIWLRAELDLLVARVGRRANRPLLKTGDPRAILARLMEARHPVYAEAELVVDSIDGSPELTLARVLVTLQRYLDREGRPSGRPRGDKGDSPMTDTVRVDLAGRPYDIAVGPGLLAEAGPRLRPLMAGRQAIVVTDATVAALHLDRVRQSLAGAGLAPRAVVLEPGEATKSWDGYRRLCEEILAGGIDRGTTIVALGGGVVGDLAGFAAATLLRGLDYVQLPTTLLAQVDSSVGGKTAIDVGAGKNLVGAFHQPRLVLADTDTLQTLPDRQLRAGYAETVKYGLIRDPAFFAWCEANAGALLARDAGALRHAVVASCRAKAAVVAADERERGERALLNFGHTFGHAIEAELGFSDALLHGEAVATGMVLAFDLSARRGLAPEAAARRVRAHLEAAGLPTRVPAGLDPRRLLEHMRKDKKTRDGKLVFVLARGIGQAFVARGVAEDEILSLLADAAG